MSDITSAGITRGTPGYGKTCRKDVLRRVGIPVVPDAAGRARPVPRRKAQVREQVAAGRACLTGGIPPADHDQFPTVPGAFVCKLAAKLPPAAVRDRPRQLVVADHSGHVQVLDHDRVGGADKAGAGTVQEVLARVTDLKIKLRLFSSMIPKERGANRQAPGSSGTNTA